MQSIIDLLYKGLKPVSGVANWIGMAMMTMMMVFVALDVTLRKLFDSPILGSIEITQFMLAICVSFGLAQCTLDKGHVVIDLFIGRLTARGRALLGAVTGLLAFGACVLVTWQLVNYIFIIKEANNVSSVLKIPMWPFVALVTFGFILFCIVLFVQFLEYILEGSGKK
ncbi:MAG: TRAP transporter small permease [Deltaproteobacteria bacterium]|nr:TRAP transporter small permease [Deltaproteobacteria bacterium]